MRLHRGLLAVAVAVAVAPAAPGVAQGAPGGIEYRTLFQNPGVPPGPDTSLEDHVIGLINATPEGERITFTFRDFNRRRVADALIAAHLRGVDVEGVIDGQERGRLVVRELLAALGRDRFVICGTPTFEFNSCITNSVRPSLQHNKFFTFSKLADGREHVVVQTSMNFFEPTQLNYYNDMVEIVGDTALYTGYVDYLLAMKAQARSANVYAPKPEAGPNTMFQSPRAQPDINTDDTIVDRMDEIDCSEGGSPSGKGLIRVANMAFRSERAVIMRKLIALDRQGCDIEVVVTNADGDILAGLVSAGIDVHPFFLRAAPPRPQVIVHSKFWLVDAKSTVTGRRTKVTYAGSSNWRPDQQYSDDMLLRIFDDGVHDAYREYWELIRSRAASDQNRPAVDTVKPSSALTATGTAGWNRSDVTVRVAGSDGHSVNASGLKRLHVEMSGAQTGSWDFEGETDGYRVEELVVSAEGETTVTYFSEDAKGNVEAARSEVIRIDKSAPVIAGVPEGCELWPPNHQMVRVADITASDGELSGLAGLSVSGSSDDVSDEGDIAISGGTVELRAEKAARGEARTYRMTAAAVDGAGNTSTATWTCEVPHSRS